MATATHSAEGRTCTVCKKPFKSADLTLRTYKKSETGNIRVAQIVCRGCWNDHYERGE